MNKHLAILEEMGCKGLELSPSMIWNNLINVNKKEIIQLKNNIEKFGLEIPSMHSLTYQRPELNFFESKDIRLELINYIVKLAEMANILHCPVMIFGSARSREINERDREECWHIMSEVFYQMAKRIKPLGVSLLIEPLSRNYTDSINTTEEGAALVHKVNHPNFGLHIDLKSSFYENEDQSKIWTKYGVYIRHCHVANPGLAPPNHDCVEHFAAAKAIQCSVYDGYVSIEMGRHFVKTQNKVAQALDFVKETYF